MNKNKKITGLKSNIIFSSITAVFLVVMLVGSYISTAVYTTAVDGFFTVYDSNKNVSSEVATSSDWIQLAKDIEGEGTILLKNANNCIGRYDRYFL